MPATYNWVTHVITPGCAVADVSLDKVDFELTVEGKLCYSKLIHEYIHYLQNFCTIWGAPVFTDLALALMKIGASSVDERGPYDRPLRPSQFKSGLLKDGFDLLATVHERIWRFSKSYTDNSKPIGPITVNFIDGNSAELSNGRLRVELGHQVIREHMAHIGEMLLLGKTDEVIHKYHEENISFKDGEPWVRQAEYWCLFEYFFGMNIYQDAAQGIFLLMQACLSCMNPHWALTRFLNWQNASATKEGGRSLVEEVQDWRSIGKEPIYAVNAWNETLKHCKKTLASAQLLSTTHDLGPAVKAITEYALGNLQKVGAGQFLFAPTDDLGQPRYWKARMHQFGTGMLQYTDAVQITGTNEHIERMNEPFQLLASCHSVVRMIQDYEAKSCPFVEDHSICKWDDGKCQHCTRDPFQMTTIDVDGGSCLFRNGVLLMGFHDRVVGVATGK